jgi:hypothetical protein
MKHEQTTIDQEGWDIELPVTAQAEEPPVRLGIAQVLLYTVTVMLLIALAAVTYGPIG